MNNKEIFEAIHKKGGEIFYVGGLVRDEILNKNNKDIDVEIFNIDMQTLKNILSKFGKVDEIGKSFGVLKIHGLDIDFCLPRTEIKNNEGGHKGFDIVVNPYCSSKEAAIRRDLTINSIMKNVISGEIVDHFGGLQDIQNKIIRCVDTSTFVEDPLRVLRVAQFSARFGFKVEENTTQLCKSMVKEGLLNTLPKERVFEELKKMLLKSEKPSIGFEFLKEINYLPKELKDLINCNQREDMHPEGDVWNHTMLVLDKSAKLRKKSDNPLVFMLGALCHDMGKPIVTDTEGRAYGHEKVGIEVARKFLFSITNEKNLIEGVLSLVENHMKPTNLYVCNSKNSAITKLQLKINKITFNDLLLLAEADFTGRGTNEEYTDIKNWYKIKLEELGKKLPKPIIGGNTLIKDFGLKPSPKFKTILDKLFELQIENNLSEKELLEIIPTLI